MGLPSMRSRLPRHPRQGRSPSTETESSRGHPRRLGPAGILPAPSMAIVCSEPQATTPTMGRRGHVRTAELDNLRLALAAFALQLAAFQIRLQLTTLQMRMN